MPNLFPDNLLVTEVNIANQESLILKGSYLFDFEKGEFVKNPDGTIKKCDELTAYKQWCQLAMATPLGLLGYKVFGHELNLLSTMSYSKDALELEVKRMTIEALMVHPLTKDIKNFAFTWNDNGELLYEYTVIDINNNSFDLNNSVEVG